MTTDSESSLPSSALPPARYPRIGSMSFAEFRDHFARFVSDLAPDERVLTAADSPLAEPLRAGPLTIGNRFTIHPMEGWDGERDGNPGPLTIARWRRFGESGAKLIWGGEAVAVREDGRGNPNQLYLAEHTLRGIERLRRALVDAHVARFGSMDGLVVGLQLTHSGRFSHFDPSRPSPRIAFEHPILDRRITPGTKVIVLSDEEIDQLVEDFVRAARQARELGFDFVDIKHSHGYLLHELLGAHTRAGRYGGSFENRTRFLRNVVTGVRREAPGLEIGVRVSAFDLVPFRPDPALTRGRELGPGIPEDFSKLLPYRYGFGGCGLLVVDTTGAVKLVDREGRASALTQMTGNLLAATVRASSVQAPAPAEPAAAAPALEAQLIAAATVDDARLAMGRQYAVDQLARVPGATVTGQLVAMCSDDKAPESVRRSACGHLGERDSGGEAVLATLRDADRARPRIGALAKAAGKLQLKAAGALLVPHVLDARTHASELAELITALATLEHAPAAAPIDRFLRLHHAEPEGSELAPALHAATAALATLRAKSYRATLDKVRIDPLTAEGVRKAASDALIALDAPPPAKAAPRAEPEPKVAEAVKPAPAAPAPDPRPRYLSAELVEATLKPIAPKLRACVTSSGPSAQARVSMTIDGNGAVERVFVTPPNVQSCIEPLVRAQRFPATQQGRQQVAHVVHGRGADKAQATRALARADKTSQ